MSTTPHQRPASGVTLIELLIGVAIVAILLALGVPSMNAWIMTQRVSAISTELLTDLQYARSESINRGVFMRVSFNSTPTQSCYTIHTQTNIFNPKCDCTLGPGAACAGLAMTERKTVTIPASSGVTVRANQDEVFLPNAKFDLNAAQLTVTVSDGGAKTLNVLASALVQRPSICVPAGSTVHGFKSC